MHPAALPHPCPLRLATVNKRKKKRGGAGLHNVRSLYKYWNRPKYVLSLTVMSESRSIGICQIRSECKGTVVQGLCCVGAMSRHHSPAILSKAGENVSY